MSLIYMDVGAWQSREKKEPKMTFALVEHNAIALCNYYSDGEMQMKSKIPNIYRNGQSNTQKNILNKNKDKSNNFEKSLINKFLSLMMEIKYGQSFKNDEKKNDIQLKRYHIIEMVTFGDGEILDNKNELQIFIPDMHLHLFKGTFLDNFITWYDNKWEYGKPVKIKRSSRKSMENDFSQFIRTIISFKTSEKVNASVTFLGDMFELWESIEGLRTFYDKVKWEPYNKKDTSKTECEKFREITNIAESVKKDYNKKYYNSEYCNLSKYIKEIAFGVDKLLPPEVFQGAEQGAKIKMGIMTRIQEPEDSLIKKLSIFLNNLSKEDIDKGEVSSDILDIKNSLGSRTKIEKATDMKVTDMRDIILTKYKGNDGINFQQLLLTLQKVCNNVRYLTGNHDNFLSAKAIKIPNGEISSEAIVNVAKKVAKAKILIPYSDLPYIFKTERSKFLIVHGHEWDFFNNDKDFSAGYSLTKITMLFEAKNRVEVLKDFDETFVSRKNYIASIICTLQAIDKRLTGVSQKLQDVLPSPDLIKNAVVIMAHTHAPYFKVIEYR